MTNVQILCHAKTAPVYRRVIAFLVDQMLSVKLIIMQLGAVAALDTLNLKAANVYQVTQSNFMRINSIK